MPSAKIPATTLLPEGLALAQLTTSPLDTAARRPRLLLSAYACSPGRGSEPGVGWNRALEAAQTCDTWVLCEELTYGPPIRAYLAEHGPIPGLTFHFVPKAVWPRKIPLLPWKRYLPYNIWQRRAYRLAQQLHRELCFDLVHHVTFCGYREPGYLHHLGVPFVWGPVGGTQNYPWRFLTIADPLGAVREATRSLLNHLQLRFSRRVRRAATTASAVLAANSTVQRDFDHVVGIQPLLQLETGIRAVRADPPVREPLPLRILWSGDLETWKALPLLLHALAALPKEIPYEVRILGQGSLRRRWQQLAIRLGIDTRISWLGWLPFAEAQQQNDWANMLVFTSLRDTSGNVVLEALAQGVPVVCLDHQGVGDIVTPSCGIKIPVTTPAQVIAGLTAALENLRREPDLLHRLGQGAIKRARDYLWSAQGERMAAVYSQILRQPQMTPVGVSSELSD